MSERAPAPDKKESPQAFQIQLGHLNITVTMAVIASVIGGFWTGVEWIDKMQTMTSTNTQELREISRKLDGLDKVLQTFNENHNKSEDELDKQMFQLQTQLTSLSENMGKVYQPNIPLRRTRRY